MEPPSLPTMVFRGVLAHIEKIGLEPKRILVDAGIDPRVFDDPEGRVGAFAALTFWDDALRVTGDPDLGLHVAEKQVDDLGVFEYALRAAGTIGEAWERAGRYFRLVHEDIEPTIEDQGGETVTLRFNMPAIPPRGIPDQILASFVLRGRSLTRRDWSPLRVCLTHPQPDDLTAYRRVFRSKLSFSAKSNAIVVARDILDTPQTTADAGLSIILDRYADELIEGLPHQGDIISRVQRVLSRELSDGDPGVQAVAKELAMSSRTLHRRLSEVGTTYRKILDELRRELSLRYLASGDQSVAEVAFLLGYSETSAFHRAFRRWMDCAPTEYQREA